MNQLVNHLVELANSLDQSGNTKCANAIDALIEHKSITKVAQYVGVIGYVLKQNRAMGNCIRKKRVANSGSMQEVVLDCLKEYQNGQQYDNNEWTSKYAQVITECPEDFESSYVDFLKVVASENNLNDHFDRVKEAHKFLQENKIEDQLISALVADINILENTKEGDSDQRPFKVAAPQSQRGFWNRLWTPSWTRRGKTKDVRLEMDNILDGIMSIHSGIQRFRNNSSRLKNLVGESAQDIPELVRAVNQLSSSDWQQSSNAIRNIGSVVGDIGLSNDPQINVIRETFRETSDDVRNVFNEITKIQRNMNYLRQRDPISGRGGDYSLGEEYGQLDRALSQLYNNPLDQRAVYYSQKLHGTLEDSIQGNWPEDQDGAFNEWADRPMSENEDIQTTPDASFVEDPTGSAPLQGGSPDELADVIVNAMAQMGDTNILSGFLEAIDQVSRETPGDPRHFAPLIAVRSKLQEKLMQEQRSPDPPHGETEIPWKSNVASDIDIFIKLADVIDPIDPELAKLVDNYIEESSNESPDLPKFPENASILKEETNRYNENNT